MITIDKKNQLKYCQEIEDKVYKNKGASLSAEYLYEVAEGEKKQGRLSNNWRDTLLKLAMSSVCTPRYSSKCCIVRKTKEM